MGVKRNTAYNLLGSLVPMVVGVITVPVYLRLIGDARYGVLALVWLFLGYFGLFDPGITRAALFHIAKLGHRGQEKEREDVFLTALAVNLCFGLIGGVAFYFVAHPFFISTFKMPDSMRGEVIACLPWLAASVPISILTGVLGGAMQAREAFGGFNLINACNAVVSQLAPLAVARWYSPNLRGLIITALLLRLVGTIPTVAVLWRALPLSVGGAVRRSLVLPLFSYGGWVTISNLVNPVLTTMDRIVIGSVIGAEGVAFYTVPFNLVSRFSLLPASLATSLFPKLSRGTEEESARIADDAVTTLAAVMTPLVVFAVLALPLFMRVWVGASFAQRAAPIGIVLLAGVWINSLAIIPFERLQAKNRPDLTAKFHILELVPFVALLWIGVHSFGLIGGAWAWTFRVTFDALLLLVAAKQAGEWRRLVTGAVLVIVAVSVGLTPMTWGKVLIQVLALVLSLLWSWYSSSLLKHTLRQQWAVFTGRRRLASV